MARGGYRPGAGGCNRVNTATAMDAVNDSTGSKPGRKRKQSPLAYMLAVMNDPAAELYRRDRMAIAAAPFVHPRVIDAVKGKKKLAAEKAVDVDASLVAELEQEAANQNVH